MKFKSFLTATAACIAATTAVPASAATLLFELSGGRNLTFELDSNPTPNSFQTFAGSDMTVFTNVSGTVNGMAAVISTISFGTGLFADFSVNAPGLGFTQFANGGPLFSGSPAAPVFAPGTFMLTNPFFASSNSTLVISEQAVSPIPEPATWAMMLLGFGLVGGAMRARRREKLTVSYA